MSWPASIFSAALTGMLGMFGAGLIAAKAVDWYNIPGREGESGYFIVALSLLGFVAGFVIGLIVARVVAAGARPGFLRALAISLTIVTVIGLASGGVARALADVPPTLDGETLLLAVEVRWPATQIEAPAAVGPDEASVSLHSIPHFSHTTRVSERGPLWMEDAHRVDGRWVVPGAVRVFTSRGTRMLSIGTGEKRLQGFQVPLPAFPRTKDLEWSEWLPRFRSGVTAPADLLSYRYRVQKVTQPIRTETIGPFEVATIANAFYEVQQDKRTLNGAYAAFSVRYRGEPLVIDAKVSRTSDSTKRFQRMDNVALVSGTRPALLMTVGSSGGTGHCYLATENGDRPRIEYVGECGIETTGRLLTSDTALFRAADRRKPIRGRIDRISYDHPGLYRLDLAVLDTRKLVVRHFKNDSTVNNNPYIRPFGLSPDERSFVTYATSDDSPPVPLLVITDFVADRTSTLPIDPARMRYAKVESLDPAWLDHHFTWQRSRDGVDRLAERAHFAPLPYRGEVSVESNGNRTYRLEKGTEPLRAALIEFLVKEFNATRLPADSGAYEVSVSIDRRMVNVAFSSGSSYVAVSLDRSSTGDSTLVATIAERFDAALATGRYDRLFAK